jgi:isoquinoline 1-oxidoreductase beta subunit
MSRAVTRREFVKVSVTAGAGLVVGVMLPGCTTQTDTTTTTSEATPYPSPPTTILPVTTTTAPSPASDTVFEPDLYLQVAFDGTVTVTVPRVEMGQGVRTALAMLAAEELDVTWESVRVETASADSRYGRQQTSGSHSIEQTFLPLRQAGAVARAMLVGAAASWWEVEQAECSTADGVVRHGATGRELRYGDLVELAAAGEVPDPGDVALKERSQFRLIGTRQGQIDERAMVTGTAVYGLDVRVSGMLYAVVARSPVRGAGIPAAYASDAALRVPGVRRVVEISAGVAVVAETTWAALEGRKALNVQWDTGQLDLTTYNSSELARTQIERAEAWLAERNRTVQAVYEMPYWAHAPMEPMNCTIHLDGDRCVVWAPTQVPQETQRTVAGVCGLPVDAVTVNVPLLGGGFGRRLSVDYVQEAAEIALAVDGPVQLVWSREDDMRHGRYQPLTVAAARVSAESPADIEVRLFPAQSRVPTEAWRSVTNVPEAFAHESALDELAAAVARDPHELRAELLADRNLRVLELAAERAAWGDPLPSGRGRGIAFHSTWDATPVAQVAEVTVDGGGKVAVDRVVCAVDCGIVVNPDMVEAQMHSGIVFGLSAMLLDEITIEQGQVEQSNYNDYPILRANQMPEVEVVIVDSDERPRGVGEMAVPPVIPAVANAIYAATGHRIRRLPVRAADLAGTT